MTVRADWKVRISLRRLLGRLEPGRSEASASRLLPVYRKAVDLGHDLLAPKSVQATFPIESAGDGVVGLPGGRAFRSWHLARMLQGADRLVIMCRTIGPALETKVRDLQTADPVLGYALDVFGVLAQSQLGRLVYEAAVGEYPGLGVTVPLAPGQLDWPVEDQALVFDFLQPDRIGVTLSETYMMWPVKSSTGVFGVGDPGRLSLTALPCETCPRQNTCDFHRESREP